VSYNVNSPELADVNSLFKTVNAANKDQIKGQANVDIFTTGYGWTGTVSQNGGLKNGSMYMLKLANGGQIEVVGTPVNADMEIPMQTGWNWIGFNPRFNMEVNESFATFNPTDGDIVKSQFDFAYYDIRKGWIGSMRYMQPGHGYMYFSHKAGKLTYPKVSILSQQRIDEEAIVENDVNGIARKYPLTMSVIAKIEGFTPSSGTSLKGEINGEVRGAVSPIDMADGTPLYFMTIHGENAAGNISFTLEDGDGNVFEVNESLSFTSDQLLGTPDQPIILTLNDQEKGGGFLADAYPNPFDESTTIVIRKIQDIAPKVKVLDLLGR
jgi:hypothetical protein